MNYAREVFLFEDKGFVPIQRPDLDPYRMELPFDWGVDPYKDPNWCFQLHTLRYLMVYLSAYKETKDNTYLSKLLGWFHDWWDWANKNTTEFLWHDMATGIRSEKIYQLVKELNANHIATPMWVRDMILQHVKVLREPGFIRVNHNHGLYAIHGLRCLAELLGPGMKVNVLALCYQDFEKIVKNQFDENYVHKEHSPHYHHLVLDSLMRYKKTKLYDDLDLLDKYIDGASDVARNLFLPDGREIPFGDTDYEFPREVAGDVDPKLRVWNESGYVVAKEGLSYICMINNFNSGVHKHWDNLSLIYGIKGNDILVDPGKYKYTNDDLRGMVVSSSSHNTVNIDGFSWGAKSLIRRSLFLDARKESRGVVVEGGMAINFNNKIINIKRKVEYYDGELVVLDEVLNKDDCCVYSRFNFHKDFELNFQGDGRLILGKKGFLVEVSVEQVEDGGHFESARYELEEMPISYRYGSCEKSISIKVFNCNLLRTKFKIIN